MDCSHTLNTQLEYTVRQLSISGGGVNGVKPKPSEQWKQVCLAYQEGSPVCCLLLFCRVAKAEACCMHKIRSMLSELWEGGLLNSSHPTCQSLPFHPVQWEMQMTGRMDRLSHSVLQVLEELFRGGNKHLGTASKERFF